MYLIYQCYCVCVRVCAHTLSLILSWTPQRHACETQKTTFVSCFSSSPSLSRYLTCFCLVPCSRLPSPRAYGWCSRLHLLLSVGVLRMHLYSDFPGIRPRSSSTFTCQEVKTSLQRLKCSVEECGLRHYHLAPKSLCAFPIITPGSQFLDNIWSTKLLINKRTLM